MDPEHNMSLYLLLDSHKPECGTIRTRPLHQMVRQTPLFGALRRLPPEIIDHITNQEDLKDTIQTAFLLSHPELVMADIVEMSRHFQVEEEYLDPHKIFQFWRQPVNHKVLEKLLSLPNPPRYFRILADVLLSHLMILFRMEVQEAPEDKQKIFNDIINSTILLNNIEFLKCVVVRDGTYLKLVPEEFKDNPELVMLAVQTNALALQYASPRLKGCRSIVLAAVQNNGDAIEYAQSELLDDRSIVLTAVRQLGSAFVHLMHQYQDDLEVALAAASSPNYKSYYRPILWFVGNELTANYDLVLAAVRQDGSNLTMASLALKDNYDIVLAAIQTKGLALRYASDRLKDCFELVLVAVQMDSKALLYSSLRLRETIHTMETVRIKLERDVP